MDSAPTMPAWLALVAMAVMFALGAGYGRSTKKEPPLLVPRAPMVAVVALPNVPVPSVGPPVVCVEREPLPYPVQAVAVR
jgi:hypothetical protein